MARKSEITAEVVATVAERLTARGQAVTNKSVLAEIGSGSMSTLVPLLSAWKAGQEEGAELAEVDVPDQITVAGEQLVSRVWRAAMQEATAGHEALRRDLLASRAETGAVRAEMLDLLAGAESDRDQAQDQVEALTVELAQAKADGAAVTARAVEAERELAAARERAAAAEARADRAEADRAAALDRVAQIDAEAGQLRDVVAGLRETVAQLTAEGAGLRDQLAASKATAAAADGRASKAEARAEKAEARADAVQIELTKTAADLSTARADLATERAGHAATRDKLGDRLERVTVDLERAEDQAAKLRAQIDGGRADA